MRLLALVWVGVLLGMPAPSLARTPSRPIHPSAGESLEALSQRLYGTRLAVSALGSFNGIGPRSAVPKLLQAPYSERRRVRSGQGWSQLAHAWFGDRLSGQDLARLLGRRPSEPPIAGEQVPVPVVIEDRLASGETLAALSRRHYGRSDRAALLMRFNGIRDPRHLFVGHKVEIPLVLELIEETRGPAADEGQQLASSTQTPDVSSAPPTPLGQFEEPLRGAVNTYLDGDYARSRQLLEELRPRVLARGNPGEKRLLLEQLVFVYSAFDETDRACESLAALLTLAPETDFDPDLVSPKVREIRDHCP